MALVILATFVAVPQTLAASQTVAPKLGKRVAVTRVSGTVLVTVPRGPRATPITGRQVIPLGSTIDVTRGVANLVAARDVQGHLQSGKFDGGAFVVTQRRSGLVDLSLTGGRQIKRGCGSARARDLARAAGLSSSVLRTLHAHVKGNFQIKGRYGAATVRGTDLTVSDSCHSTSIRDHSGSVDTSSQDGKLTQDLIPGETDLYRCGRSGSSRYCLELDGFNERGVASYFQPGISISRPESNYDLCVTPPSGRPSCTTWIFTNPLFVDGNPATFGNYDLLFCDAAHKGNYSVTWRLGGAALGPPLTFRSLYPSSDIADPCHGFFGNDDRASLFVPLPADVKQVNRFVLPASFALDSLLVYLSPTGVAGSEVVKGVVYADANGRPGPLQAVTDPFTFKSGMKADTQVLSFPARPSQQCVGRALESYCRHFAAGAYWIGLISGGDSNVAAVGYDSVPGIGAFNTNPFSLGPSDPFGPSSGDDRFLTVEALYTTETTVL